MTVRDLITQLAAVDQDALVYIEIREVPHGGCCGSLFRSSNERIDVSVNVENRAGRRCVVISGVFD